MTSPAAFRDQTNWSIGYYELAIEVGSSEDAQIQAVLSALWFAADVHGCFGRRDIEPEEQDPVPCTVGSLTEFGHLHGQVRLPTGQLVVCGCVAIRGGDESSDWLDSYVPVSALDQAGLAFWAGRPFFRSDVMDEWLAAIGAETFKRASFSLGVIGFEVSGCTDASTLAGKLPREVRGFRKTEVCSAATRGSFRVYQLAESVGLTGTVGRAAKWRASAVTSALTWSTVLSPYSRMSYSSSSSARRSVRGSSCPWR